MSKEITPNPRRNILSQIFISSNEPRLRAGWRLLLQTGLLGLLLGCLGATFVALLIFAGVVAPDVQEFSTPLLLVLQFIQAFAFIMSVYLARRFLDRRSFESLGLRLSRQALLDTLTGIGITFVQMGSIFLLMLGLGWMTFDGFAWQKDSLTKVFSETLMFLLFFIITGFSEEILSRGYHLQTITSGLNLFWGIFLSSSIFGLLHFYNPDATWISTFGIFIAGLFFAFAYLCTRQLWLPIGLHIGWNFFEGVVFGFPVSGLDVYPLARVDVTGPVLWTGGAFGPEAGLIVLPALILGALLIYFYTLKRISHGEPQNDIELKY